MAQGCLKGWLAIPWYGFSAIHTTYRNWLRSSSMYEPRDPPSEVVKMVFLKISSTTFLINNFVERGIMVNLFENLPYFSGSTGTNVLNYISSE